MQYCSQCGTQLQDSDNICNRCQTPTRCGLPQNDISQSGYSAPQNSAPPITPPQNNIMQTLRKLKPQVVIAIVIIPALLIRGLLFAGLTSVLFSSDEGDGEIYSSSLSPDEYSEGVYFSSSTLLVDDYIEIIDEAYNNGSADTQLNEHLNKFLFEWRHTSFEEGHILNYSFFEPQLYDNSSIDYIGGGAIIIKYLVETQEIVEISTFYVDDFTSMSKGHILSSFKMMFELVAAPILDSTSTSRLTDRVEEYYSGELYMEEKDLLFTETINNMDFYFSEQRSTGEAYGDYAAYDDYSVKVSIIFPEALEKSGLTADYYGSVYY